MGKMHTHFQYRLEMYKFWSVFLFLFGGFAFNCASAQNKNTPAAPSAPVVCSAADFKALAYTINETQLREERAKEWLSKYGKSCPLDQLEIILSNQAVWLGTADTPVIISSIETIYKQKKAAGEEGDKLVDKPKGSAINKK